MPTVFKTLACKLCGDGTKLKKSIKNNFMEGP